MKYVILFASLNIGLLYATFYIGSILDKSDWWSMPTVILLSTLAVASLIGLAASITYKVIK